jgi:Cys/Met metabolism PLP-dependent enzyme
VTAVPADSAEYLARLAAGLLDECRADGLVVPPQAELLAAGVADFGLGWLHYRQACAAVAAQLDADFEPAAAYDTMEEFWADAADQETGASAAAYWDSYENGRRRRLEQRCAVAFGSEQAVLVNTGMSALDVAIRSAGVRPGDVILVHDRQYFETSDLLTGVYEPWSLTIVPVDMRDADLVRTAVHRHAPALALVETVLNGVRCDVPVLEPLLEAGVPVVVDCSALGHGIDPRDLASGPAVLYVESGMKYLTRSASCGVVYGWGEWAAQARIAARRTGQQLQGRALHRIRPAEVDLCRRRLALHADRRERFITRLGDIRPELVVTDACSSLGQRDDRMARVVRGGASGCLVFVRLPVDAGADVERAYRDLVAGWAATVHAPRVRAGFGWTFTSSRAYGKDALNTAAGEAYARISVGIQPAAEVLRLATDLAAIAKKVSS